MTRLEILKNKLSEEGVTNEMLIENAIDNATMLSIAFDGEGKDSNVEYLMSIAVGNDNDYIDSVHVTKDLVLTKENVFKILRAVNDMNVESIGVIYSVDMEDKSLTASMYANGTHTVDELYDMIADTMDAAVENFQKV